MATLILPADGDKDWGDQIRNPLQDHEDRIVYLEEHGTPGASGEDGAKGAGYYGDRQIVAQYLNGNA